MRCRAGCIFDLKASDVMNTLPFDLRITELEISGSWRIVPEVSLFRRASFHRSMVRVEMRVVEDLECCGREGLVDLFAAVAPSASMLVETDLLPHRILHWRLRGRHAGERSPQRCSYRSERHSELQSTEIYLLHPSRSKSRRETAQSMRLGQACARRTFPSKQACM